MLDHSHTLRIILFFLGWSQVLLSGKRVLRGDSTLIASKSYDQPSNSGEAGQGEPSEAGHRLPGRDRKSGRLK